MTSELSGTVLVCVHVHVRVRARVWCGARAWVHRLMSDLCNVLHLLATLISEIGSFNVLELTKSAKVPEE